MKKVKRAAVFRYFIYDIYFILVSKRKYLVSWKSNNWQTESEVEKWARNVVRFTVSKGVQN